MPPFCCILSPSPLWTLHPCLSISLSSLSSGTHKPKDPPWLALVQSDSKKKKAPAPPPAGLATPPNTGSLSSLKGDGSRPSTPPPPANPFDEDDDDENNEVEEEGGSEGGAVPASVAASHPWYSITRAADASGGDTPPSGGSSSRSASPGSTKNKKRPAPRAPQPPAGSQGQLNQHYIFLTSDCAFNPFLLPCFVKTISYILTPVSLYFRVVNTCQGSWLKLFLSRQTIQKSIWPK